MLIAEPTRQAAGIKIYGDYLDLTSLHKTIHYLVDGVPIGGVESEMGKFVLGLAYELRHAFRGDRETKQFGHDAHDTVHYQGFQYLWPHILPTVGLLKWSASFHTTTRNVQANLFRIEECIENALIEIDPNVGEEVFEWLSNFLGLSDNYYTQFIDECAIMYLESATSKKARFKKLPEILHMMAPWRDEYIDYSKYVEHSANENKCSPHELTSFDKWPEFKW